MTKLFAGLDVSDKSTAICVVDAVGTIVFECEVETTSDAIGAALKPYRRRLKLVGQESGFKALALQRGLSSAKFPIVCLDARHAHAALNAKLNKTDTNDAYGLACLLAGGRYSLAHVKTDEAMRLRTILMLRLQVMRKAKDMRLALMMVDKSAAPLPPRKRIALRSDSEVALSRVISRVRATSKGLDDQMRELDRLVFALAYDHPVCARLMTIPGVGPLTALNFVAGVDDPHRFKESRTVAAFFGLTPRAYQSGEITRSGGISRRGDANVRRALFNAGRVLLINSRSQCSLRVWGLRIAKAKGSKIAIVACARKLAVLMHHLWVTGQEFDPSR